MYFDEKLKALREKTGLTLEEAAKKLDVTEGTLQSLETGFKDPDRIEMRKITELYNVTEEELADDEPYVNAFSVLFEGNEPGSNPLAGTFAFAAGLVGAQTMKNDTSSEDAPFDVRKIPLIKNITLESENPVYDCLESYIASCNLPEGEYIALHVTDDTLGNIGINKGDLAIAKIQSTAEVGNIVIVLQNDNLTLKQVVKNDNNILCFNDCLKDIAQSLIVGKIIETRKYFK